jgi:lysophospholipase L1-like esterase
MRGINNKTFGSETATQVDERIISFNLIGSNTDAQTFLTFYNNAGAVVGEANAPVSAALLTSKSALLSALQSEVGTVDAARIVTSNGRLHKVEYTIAGVRGSRIITYELPEYGDVLTAMQTSGSFTLRGDTTADGKQPYLIVGDSIANGTSISGKGPTPPAGIMYEWNGSALVEVGSNDLSNANTGSQYPKMAIDLYGLTNNKTVIINGALGGSEFSPNGDSNNWSTSGTLYSAATSKVSAALSNMGLSALRGIILILGINDARGGVSLTTINSDINSLFSRLNASYPNVPIYVCNIGRSETGVSTTRIDAVRGYISSAVSTYNNCYMAADLREYAVAGNLYSADNLHLNQLGCNRLGAQLAKYITHGNQAIGLDTTIHTIVDDGRYNAFGNVFRLNSTTAMMPYRSGTSHLLNGRIQYKLYDALTDTWSAPVIVKTPADTKDFRDPRGGVLGGEKVIIFSSTYNEPDGTFDTDGYILSSDLSLSSWSDYTPLTWPPGITRGITFGVLVESGTPNVYYASAYGLNEAGTYWGVWLWKITYASGTPTFERIDVYFGTTKVTECTIENLGSGKFIILARVNDSNHLVQFTSNDGGLTWSAPVNTNIGVVGNINASVPGKPLLMNGYLCFLYMDRLAQYIKLSISVPNTVFSSPTSWSPTNYVYNANLGYPDACIVPGYTDRALIIWCLETSSTTARIFSRVDNFS